MALIVEDLALQAIRLLRPLVPKIRKHDRSLADDMKRAASSAALNIGEAAHSCTGNRRARFLTAAGSASEVRATLRVAAAWGYIDEHEATEADAVYDRMLGMLWGLTGGRR